MNESIRNFLGAIYLEYGSADFDIISCPEYIISMFRERDFFMSELVKMGYVVHDESEDYIWDYRLTEKAIEELMDEA